MPCLQFQWLLKKLSAKVKKLPLYKTFFIKKNFQLPYPLMNIINGGAHANNGLRIQEFMIRPDRAKSFSEAMRICFIVIKNLSKLIKDKGLIYLCWRRRWFCPNDQ